jgi:hypothetical protein
MKVRFRPRAIADLQAIIRWYDDIAPESTHRIVGAESFDLLLDRAADRFAIAFRLGKGRKSQQQADQKAQKAFAHRLNPRLEKTGPPP